MDRVSAPWVLKPRTEAGAMGIKKINEGCLKVIGMAHIGVLNLQIKQKVGVVLFVYGYHS